MPTTKQKRILLADDDVFMLQPFIDRLEHEGYQVVTARSGEEILSVAKNHRGRFALVILDIMMPRGSTDDDTTIGLRTGLWAARELKKQYKNIKLMGLSVVGDESVIEWFQKYGVGYYRKPCTPGSLLDGIHRAIYGRARRPLKAFIVHGHDEKALTDLQKYLASDPLFDTPIVLRDQPNLGRTIIEKFEREAAEVDVAFVLLTPDDTAYSTRTPNTKRRRSRQNVIFELGYFYGRFQRTSGRIILLYKGVLELPSDISGVVYIDISKGGIRSATKQIRREVEVLL